MKASNIFIGLLVIVLIAALLPTDTLSHFLGNARDNKEAIQTAIATPIPPSPTTTIIAAPSELGDPTQIATIMATVTGFPTEAATKELVIENPDYAEQPDMMKYREALETTIAVNQRAYLVTGILSGEFTGDSTGKLYVNLPEPPKAVTLGLGLIGISIPDTYTFEGSQVSVATTASGAIFMGVDMNELVATTVATGDGQYEKVFEAPRKDPATGEEKMYDIFRQGVDIYGQPTICMIGVHVNGTIVNTQLDNPSSFYRTFFPYDYGNLYELAWAEAYHDWTSQEHLSAAAETARESLVNGSANQALCALMSLIDGKATKVNSCTFVPRVPEHIQYCGDLEVAPISTPTPPSQ